MWSVVSHGFQAGFLSLLELQTFKLKENNVTNTQHTDTEDLILFYMICLNEDSPSCKILFDVSAIQSINSRQGFKHTTHRY